MEYACFFLLLIAGIALFLQAQSLIPLITASAGDIFSGKNRSLSQPPGETAIKSVSSETRLLTERFHQLHFQSQKVDSQEDPYTDVLVYPNPVNDMLTIKIVATDRHPSIRLELFDFSGRRIYERDMLCQTFTEQLDVSKLNSSLLILRVTNLKTQKTESFKIHNIKI
jgi:hypothetical protein